MELLAKPPFLPGSGATLMMWWMGGVDYPLVVGGKPGFTLPSSVPIMFELMVLLAKPPFWTNSGPTQKLNAFLDALPLSPYTSAVPWMDVIYEPPRR